MELIKATSRNIKAKAMFEGMKAVGASVEHIDKFSKFKELEDGIKVEISFNVYEINNEFAVLVDAVGRLATNATPKAEVMSWLEEHGYKDWDRFEIEENGVDPEAWAMAKGEC